MAYTLFKYMQEFKKQASFSFMELLVAAAVQFISDNQLCQRDVLNLSNNKTTHLWLNFSADNVNFWHSRSLLMEIHSPTNKYNYFPYFQSVLF